MDIKNVIQSDKRFVNRPEVSDELLEVVNVDKKYRKYLRVLDEQDNLKLLHYIQIYEDGTKQIDEDVLKHVGHVRGLVVDTDTNNIVCRSYGYTPEIVSTDKQKLSDLLPSNLTTVQFYKACEGTIIRVFWANDKWYVSTHRKIDASTSYWSGPTFGDMFEELRNFDYGDLNKEHCYVFLMSHKENRFIYPVEEQGLMLVTVYDTINNRYLMAEELNSCKYPQHVEEKWEKMEQLLDGIEEFKSFNQSGVIAFTDISNPHPIKIVNPFYKSLVDARGNEPSIRNRYIELRRTIDGELLISWFNEPKHRMIYESVELEIDYLAKKVHRLYINRFIKKDFGELPKEEFVVVQRCHTWHKDNRKENIVTVEKVQEILNDTPNFYLKIMLNRQRTEKRVARMQALHPEF